MLIESYVVGFPEVKRCLASLRSEDYVVISENIFMLKESGLAMALDLLSDTTPSNHPEVLLVINKDHAKDLIMDSDAFAFRKPEAEVANLAGVTLHLCFAGDDLIKDLQAGSMTKNIDGIPVRAATLQAVLLAKQNQKKRFEEHQEILRKSVLVYRKDM
jgi:hypothetical protein